VSSLAPQHVNQPGLLLEHCQQLCLLPLKALHISQGLAVLGLGYILHLQALQQQATKAAAAAVAFTNTWHCKANAPEGIEVLHKDKLQSCCYHVTEATNGQTTVQEPTDLQLHILQQLLVLLHLLKRTLQPHSTSAALLLYLPPASTPNHMLLT
jgi:hypothetical protein